MRKGLPPLNWLRSFEAAARHLSFTGAAAELHITQSAVSQQVKGLEHYLGQAVFLRKARGLALTDAGRDFLPTVTEAFKLLRTGTEAFHGRDPGTVLEVKANTSFANLWLVPRLGEFLAQHPWVHLDLTSAFWATEFSTSSAGVLVRYGRGDWDGGAGTQLGTQMVFPVCSPELATQLREPADLQEQTLLSVRGTDDWDYWAAAHQLPSPQGRVEHFLMSFVFSIDMARRGLGVALGHEVICGELIERGELVAPFELRTPSRDNYYLITPRPKQMNEAARTFAEWLQEALSDV